MIWHIKRNTPHTHKQPRDFPFPRFSFHCHNFTSIKRGLQQNSKTIFISLTTSLEKYRRFVCNSVQPKHPVAFSNYADLCAFFYIYGFFFLPKARSDLCIPTNAFSIQRALSPLSLFKKFVFYYLLLYCRDVPLGKLYLFLFSVAEVFLDFVVAFL